MPTVTIINPISEIKTDNKLRVAAYCRVSSNSADQQNSYAVQLAYYGNKFSDSETETLVEIYADEGISGTRDDKRVEFQRMINDCRKGKIDRIYSKSISRFARNTRDCLKYIRELKSLGITILFEKEGIDTAKITDEMMITIMGGLAQEESVSISQNMQWSIRKRMRIYLVTDFDGECASKILFESEGVSGYSAESFRAWQETARCFGDCSEETSGTGVMFENHSQDTRYTGPLEVAQTVSATYGTGGNNQPFVVEAAGFCTEHSAKARGIGYEKETAPTLRAGVVPATLKIRCGGGNGGKGNDD